MRNAESQSCASEYLRTCVCQSGVWSCPKTEEATRSAPKSKLEISILCEERHPQLDEFSSRMTAEIRHTNIVPRTCCKKDSIAAGKGIPRVQLSGLEVEAYGETI